MLAVLVFTRLHGYTAHVDLHPADELVYLEHGLAMLRGQAWPDPAFAPVYAFAAAIAHTAQALAGQRLGAVLLDADLQAQLRGVPGADAGLQPPRWQVAATSRTARWLLAQPRAGK